MSVNVAILGFAHGHVAKYIEKWEEEADLAVNIKAGWDHDADRLEKFAGKHGFTAYRDIHELLDSESVGAVVIAAETSMHADLVESAADAGKKIVLQKPMALTMQEADRIVDAVRRNDVGFTMAWQMRVDEQNIRIKELIDKGVIGRVFMVRRRHGLSVCLKPAFADSWHMDPEANRDIWADDSAHPIDFVNWLFGKPKSVTAEIVSLHDERMPMDNGVAIFRYPGGPLVEVACSFTNHACENTTEVIGEKGSIVQNYGDVPSCNVPRPENSVGLKWYLAETGEWSDSRLSTPRGHGERIAALAYPLAAFMRGDGAPLTAPEEARTSLRMTLACYVSAEEGRRVAIDDPAVEKV